jgi:hypothetical protein
MQLFNMVRPLHALWQKIRLFSAHANSSRPQESLALYDQIFLLGDSITEFSENGQAGGFGFGPAVRAGMSPLTADLPSANLLIDYIRRLDVVNRGLRYGLCKLPPGINKCEAAIIPNLLFGCFNMSFRLQGRRKFA